MLKFIIGVFLVTFHSLSAIAENVKIHLDHPIKKVLLVVAMEAEATPIIAALNLHKIAHVFSGLPMQGYVGKYKKVDVMLVMNGIDPVNHVQNVGTQASTLSTFLGVQYFHPDLIISIGVAGGVEQNGAKEKEIYVSRKIYFYDRRLAFKGYHEYALGDYPSAQLSQLDKTGLKPGIVCSGDSFDDNQTDYDRFIKYDCSAIDMEAAGVAWVAMLTKTPMLAMKGISNFVRGDNIHDRYQENLPVVTQALSDKLKELLVSLSLS
jgi:nucleoside phosphorylase